MKNYDILIVTVQKGTNPLEGVVAQERGKICGSADGLTSYLFNPPLTKEEVEGLVQILVEKEVNSFEFRDSMALKANL